MALSTGIKYPTTISAPGFSNPANATGAPNGTSATFTAVSGTEFQVTAWGYGFALPANAIPRGCKVYPTTSASSSVYTYSNLVNADTYTPCSVSFKNYIPAATLSTLSMGGDTDLWGGVSTDGSTYARDWTPADINSPYFGVQLNIGANAPPSTFTADAFGIEWLYDLPSPPSGMMFRSVG